MDLRGITFMFLQSGLEIQSRIATPFRLSASWGVCRAETSVCAGLWQANPPSTESTQNTWNYAQLQVLIKCKQVSYVRIQIQPPAVKIEDQKHFYAQL